MPMYTYRRVYKRARRYGYTPRNAGRFAKRYVNYRRRYIAKYGYRG